MNEILKSKPTHMLASVLTSFLNPSEESIKRYHLKKNHYNSECYPEEYGGAFYNSASNRMSLFLTNPDGANEFLSLIDMSYIDIVQVQYPLYYLLNCLKNVSDFGSHWISSACVIQKDNKIHISCPSEEAERKTKIQIEELSINKDVIVFDPISPPAKPMSIIKAGKPIYRNGTAYGGTVCCNAYRLQSQQYGIVTCRHVVFSSTNYLVDENNTIVGSNFNYYHLGGSSDCIFVPFSGYNWSQNAGYICHTNSSLYGKIYATTYVVSSFEGDTIVKYGKATGKTTGTIISTACTSDSMTYPDGLGQITLYDMVKSSNNIQGGDSGGPVGFEITYNGSKYLNLLGMATAGVDNSYTLSCKITNVIGALGISVFTNPLS